MLMLVSSMVMNHPSLAAYLNANHQVQIASVVRARLDHLGLLGLLGLPDRHLVHLDRHLDLLVRQSLAQRLVGLQQA